VSIPLKVNLILLMVAAIVIELFAVISVPFLEEIARAEVVQKARIMMEAAAGIRTYTANEIAPLLNAKVNGQTFHPQTVPAYAASKNFALLASKFADYAYHEPALNPINPSNRAVDWEADIINDFRRNPHKGELITERDTHNGRVLNLSHPIISREHCLSCHGTADKAPKSMIATYGTQTGFGWRLNEIIGAQIVSVPMAVALDQSARIRNLFIGVLVGVFLLLIGLFNLLPILVTRLYRVAPGPGDKIHRRAPVTETVKAFGYGLSAAGIVVAVVAYALIFARHGIVGLQEALNPFAPINYISVVAVAPGVLTIGLASYMNRHYRNGALR
jgi:protein-histidine pros-kinase